MAQFVRTFNDALGTNTSIELLHVARDAFSSPESDDEKDIVIHLQSDETFLHRLVKRLLQSDISITQSNAILELIFSALFSSLPITASFVKLWIESVQLKFPLDIVENSVGTGDVSQIKTNNALVLMISLEVIESAKNVPLNAQTLNSEFFLSSPDVMMLMHNAFLSLAEVQRHCAPLFMAWGMYLHKLLQEVSQGLEHDSAYEPIFDKVFFQGENESHRLLIEEALTGNLYLELMDIIAGLPMEHNDRYKSVLLNLFDETQNYIQLSQNTPRLFSLLITSRALANLCWEKPSLMRMVERARQQFPHEYTMFVRLLRGLSYSGTAAATYLDMVQTFTQTLPVGFQAYEVIGEEGGQSLVELKQPLKVFAGRPGDRGITIDSGARGIMISSPRGSLVLWRHRYSALQYMFRVLQSSASRLTINNNSEDVGETLDVFTNLIGQCDHVDDVLKCQQEGSIEGLPSTVLQIYEQALQGHGELSVIISSLQFFTTLLKVAPVLAWPLIPRLGFENRLGTSDVLGDFTATLEATGQACRFVSAYCALVNAALTNLVDHALTLGDRLRRIKTQFFSTSVLYMLNCFKSYTTWRVSDLDERYALGRDLSHLFAGLLTLCFDNHLASCDRTMHVHEIILPAAKSVCADLIGKQSRESGQGNNFRRATNELANEKLKGDNTGFIHAVFRLYAALLKVPSSATITSKDELYHTCFATIPLLVSSWSRQPESRRSTVKLMITVLEHNTNASTSILALLAEGKDSFRRSLLDYVLKSTSLSQAESADAWRLLNCFIGRKQEGLALFLLEKSDAKEVSLLEAISDHLTTVVSSPPLTEVTVEMLRSVVAAQSWSYLVHEQLGSNQQFWSNIRQLFRSCNAVLSNQSDEQVTVQDCHRLIGAGLIAQILATEFTCLEDDARKTEDWKLTTLLDLIVGDSSAIKHYRASLHGNLNRNLSQKYPGFTLTALSRTDFVNHKYGENFCYDLCLAQQLIQANSFIRELRTANFNLSLMDAQGYRFRGFLILASTAVLLPIPTKEQWQSVRAIVHGLLRQDLDVPVLQGLSGEAIRTTAILVQSLCDTSAHATVHDLLEILGDLIQRSEVQKTTQTVSATRTSFQSICRLLESLSKMSIPRNDLLSLQRHLSIVFGQVVCTHIKYCCDSLRGASNEELLDRMSVLIVMGRLLSRMIKKHDLPRTFFASELSRSNVLEGLIGLFTEYDNLSDELQFRYAYTLAQSLLTLYDVTEAADQMMHAGVFRLLLDSKVCHEVQSATAPISGAVMDVWVSGILPLILCLVNSLGVRIKDEVEILMHAYSRRIEHNFASWTKPTGVNSLMTRELILTVLLSGSYDNMLKEPDEEYKSTREMLSGRLEYLLAHPKTTAALSADGGDESEITGNLEIALDLLRSEESS